MPTAHTAAEYWYPSAIQPFHCKIGLKCHFLHNHSSQQASCIKELLDSVKHVTDIPRPILWVLIHHLFLLLITALINYTVFWNYWCSVYFNCSTWHWCTLPEDITQCFFYCERQWCQNNYSQLIKITFRAIEAPWLDSSDSHPNISCCHTYSRYMVSHNQSCFIKSFNGLQIVLFHGTQTPQHEYRTPWSNFRIYAALSVSTDRHH